MVVGCSSIATALKLVPRPMPPPAGREPGRPWSLSPTGAAGGLPGELRPARRGRRLSGPRRAASSKPPRVRRSWPSRPTTSTPSTTAVGASWSKSWPASSPTPESWPRPRALGLQPWAPAVQFQFVRIRAELVSGRRLLPQSDRPSRRPGSRHPHRTAGLRRLPLVRRRRAASGERRSHPELHLQHLRRLLAHRRDGAPAGPAREVPGLPVQADVHRRGHPRRVARRGRRHLLKSPADTEPHGVRRRRSASSGAPANRAGRWCRTGLSALPGTAGSAHT